MTIGLTGLRSVGMEKLSPAAVMLAPLNIWDVPTGEHRKTLTGHTRWINAVAFSLDGQTLVSGGDDGTIRMWDTSTGEHKKTLTRDGIGDSIVFSPSGHIFATGTAAGEIHLWNTETGAHIRKHSQGISEVSVASRLVRMATLSLAVGLETSASGMR